TCKGCNVCVDVCPDGALRTIRQSDEVVESLRRSWAFWEALPETDDRYIKIASMEEGIGVLSSLLLKKANYQSLVGGDGACMGCGEKTVLHLVTSTVHGLVLPKVQERVARIDALIQGLGDKARGLLASDVELDQLETDDSEAVRLPLDRAKQDEVERIVTMIKELRHLRWLYTEGPSGHGRAALGFTNSTGCSSVWASTYPYNPYPFPWVNHLFQDAPSVALGIFEGHMRKMADSFVTVRRAELELTGDYDPARHEAEFADFDWHQFNDDEFALCPPIIAVGGDGAMMDIGFQNLSRLMAAGKPLRVVVLDTQVYSNTGGQACTSGYTGQVSDMAMFGRGQHGKTETRKELSLIALAHRNVYVVQSTQATASHLIGGVLRGLRSKRPAVFLLHSPCPPEHGIADDASARSSRMAVESRAFPVLEFDPDGGPALADCLSLDGNPALEDPWPSYSLSYLDDEGKEQSMELPLTTADWAAAEGRFKKHFRPAKDGDELVLFHEYVAMSAEEREGCKPFIYHVDREQRLSRVEVSVELVQLAEDRLRFWDQLREMAGLQVSSGARGDIEAELEQDFEQRIAALRQEYEGKLAELRDTLPKVVAHRMAEGLLSTGDGSQTVDEVLRKALGTKGLEPINLVGLNGEATFGAPAAAATGAAPAAAPTPAEGAATEPEAATATAVEEAAPETDDDDDFAVEAHIDSARCTSCNECTNLNNKMFAYNDQKQAYVKDPSAGTFQQLVKAAEACPVGIIHPGTPL
ncbi:MAG: ferredoxin, partial [Caldilineaceae bacterium]|nr:ferredoxin [Caldilineaceae bacterium]